MANVALFFGLFLLFRVFWFLATGLDMPRHLAGRFMARVCRELNEMSDIWSNCRNWETNERRV